MTNGLALEIVGPVATIWLDRPAKRNAMNAAMWAGLPGLVDDAAADRGVRVLVVRGRGEHFCAGADITELGPALAADSEAVAYRTLNSAAESALADVAIPTVAAIDGSCIGGGVQLALACDIRIATRRAMVGITASRLGISFPAPSLERLVATVGAPAARRLVMTAAVLDAHAAQELGLVDEVVDHGHLDAAVSATSDALTATSAVTQLAAKEMVAAVVRDGRVPETLARRWEAIASTGGDLTEGLTAFLEKRSASFGPRPEVPDS